MEISAFAERTMGEEGRTFANQSFTLKREWIIDKQWGWGRINDRRVGLPPGKGAKRKGKAEGLVGASSCLPSGVKNSSTGLKKKRPWRETCEDAGD